MRSIRLGLIGFGIIGSGVVRVLQKNARVIESRVGAKIELAKIADLDITTDRDVKVDPKILTTDGFSVCTDPEIDIVIELVGGTGIAAKFIETALKNGKHVVTANKALLSEKGAPLFELAEKEKKLLLFEAAVGGAIPIIRTLKQDLAGEELTKIYGIVNGTCNYILTKLESGEMSFEAALREAQEKGFAEADPTLDIEGIDSAHKLALLASLAWGTEVDFKQIYVEGITKLSSHDFLFAKRLNRVIKLIAVGKKEGDTIELRVTPTLLRADSTLTKIGGVTNAIALFGPHLGEILLSGRGAGSLPTATAVLGDIAEAARTLLAGAAFVPNRGVQPSAFQHLPLKQIDEVESEYYLRFNVKDQPGVLSALTKALADYELSIRDILQLDLHEFEKTVPLVMILHACREARLRAAIKEIDKLKCIREKTVVLRVEE